MVVTDAVGHRHRAVRRDDPFLDEIATHLIDAGGKRLRPALTLTSASLAAPRQDGPGASDETLLGAVSVELVHLASLYHDDVMDEATRRRNVVSVNARWGNLLAIVAGDYLLARSAEIAASLGTEVAGLLAATLARLCHGQVAEVRAAYRLDRTEEDYFNTIADKTAALISAERASSRSPATIATRFPHRPFTLTTLRRRVASSMTSSW